MKTRDISDTASAHSAHRPAPAHPPAFPVFGHHRGNGKVARLPSEIREQINEYLVEGRPYRDIIDSVARDGFRLTSNNISEWKKRGHQEWLLEQAWLTQIRLRQDTATDVSACVDASHLSHAALQLALLQMFEALRELGTPSDISPDLAEPPAAPADHIPDSPAPDSSSRRCRSRSKLDLLLGGDSSAFFRFIQTLVRAAKQSIEVQKYRREIDARRSSRSLLDDLSCPGLPAEPRSSLDELEARTRPKHPPFG